MKNGSSIDLLCGQVRLKDLTLDCVRIHPYMGSIVTHEIQNEMVRFLKKNV